jgi:segregation and condensation protein B
MDIADSTSNDPGHDLSASHGSEMESLAVQEDTGDAPELTAILEALLFVSGEPVPVARLATVIGTVSKAEVEQALRTLKAQLEQEGRGIQLVQIAGGYRLVTKLDCAPWLKRLDKAKAAQKLSRSALESLAIIAYKQPLVRSEIEEIRGVETSGVLRTLLERKLVRIVGRKEVPGRPIMYGTTKFFLEHFGLQDLGQLPPLREFKELGESEQAMLPIEETADLDEGAGPAAPSSGEKESAQSSDTEGTFIIEESVERG